MNQSSHVMVYPERSRAIYNKIKSHLKKQSFSGVVQPGTLRTETYLVNGQQDYALALKDNAPKLASNAGREIRLKEQDAFVWTRVRVGVLLEIIAGPVGGEPTYFYNPLLPFADEVGGFQNAHLSAIWNGQLFLKVGDTVYLDAFPINKSYQVGTQQTTASLKSEQNGEYGWINLTPQYAIKGFDDNDFRAKFPNINANHKVQWTATNKNVLVVEVEGFKITGAGTGKLDLQFANE